MKIHRDLAQKSWAWFVARAGKVTGSELKNLMTDKFQIRKWSTEMPNTYLHRKLAEKWRGEALQSFGGNQQTDQGLIYEERARNYFSCLLERDIETVGGLESEDGKLWCSPDGIIWDGLKTRYSTGLEIKCPNADNHVGWLLADMLPEEHALQCHFGLLVSGFHQWQFLSYCKDMPHLAIPVDRDDEIIDLISEAVEEFNARMDAGFARLCEMNGGPPPERKPFVPSSDSDPRKELFQGIHDPDDVVP